LKDAGKENSLNFRAASPISDLSIPPHMRPKSKRKKKTIQQERSKRSLSVGSRAKVGGAPTKRKEEFAEY